MFESIAAVLFKWQPYLGYITVDRPERQTCSVGSQYTHRTSVGGYRAILNHGRSMTKYNNRNNKRKLKKRNTLTKVPKSIESRTTMFYDFGFASSVTSTGVQYSILDPLKNNLLLYFQTLWEPSLLGWSPGVRILNAKLRIEHIDVRIIFTGAQSTTLLAGDLFNSIRHVLYLTGNSPLDAQPVPLNNISEFLDVRDVKKVYTDQVIPLPSQAFDTVNSYNVPQVVQRTYRLKVNRQFTWWTSDPTGASGWDTREGNINCALVSDSLVSPHPTVEYRLRVYYSY